MGGPGSGQKPGAKPTRTTRHGNGAGWGGPARGSGHAPRKGRPAFRPGNTAAKSPETEEMKTRQELRAMTRAQRKEEYLEGLHEVISDPETPANVKVSAIVHAMDRDIGKPVSEEEAGDAGKTIVVRGGFKRE